MQTLHQKPVIILIHEIYGINDHMETTIKHFERAGFEVYCPELLGPIKPFGRDSEGDAYRYFMKEVGFDRSVDKVLHLARELKAKDKSVSLFALGFSVGATVAWLCSRYDGLFTGVIGFYGSRIRDYMTISPKCETLLFFPTIENAFKPREIVSVLEKKKGVHVMMVEGRHGFANPYSEAFKAPSKDRCFQHMSEFIKVQLNKVRSAERV
ncbi:dienelactone hydrolase family protein [Bacillus xiamenensis]|uniref:dienelactone hydrolase family protein n=1 Tax=Bacillus xiamenensis TaxID=1178537 RepID=UPI00028EF3D9|nr:dienelactone hydrolase family protein [Bacillus xiamenensis]EKF35865.1 dienelactone hydrolase [Bacillus xiamenensis]MCW1838089.1 dienelactone hydrolase family protein [Bacillus xiamenensis]